METSSQTSSCKRHYILLPASYCLFQSSSFPSSHVYLKSIHSYCRLSDHVKDEEEEEQSKTSVTGEIFLKLILSSLMKTADVRRWEEKSSITSRWEEYQRVFKPFSLSFSTHLDCNVINYLPKTFLAKKSRKTTELLNNSQYISQYNSYASCRFEGTSSMKVNNRRRTNQDFIPKLCLIQRRFVCKVYLSRHHKKNWIWRRGRKKEKCQRWDSTQTQDRI